MVFRQIDATAARINSLWIAVVVVLFLTTSHVAWLFFLSVDYIVRLYGQKVYSPIHLFSVGVKQLLKIPTKMSDAGAKRLASQFGLLFVILMIVAFYVQYDLMMYVVAGVFLLCLALDFLLNFCVGCKVYYLIKKIYPEF